jgi:c-di-GMP-binding flagellar brake protein YcgR
MRPLTRRSQIELLASACQTHEPVRLEVQGGEPAQVASEGHLLACDRGSLLVELSGSQATAAEATPASRISARFGHRGRRFAFSTTVLASVPLPAANRARAGVRLAMPLVVRERAARTAERIRPAGNAPVHVDLLTVGPEKSCIRGRITDVSTGGVGCELAAEDAPRLDRHELIRLRAAGPAAPRDCEFIVRLVHADAISERLTRIGLAFVGLDDAAELDARLRRLQDWISDAVRVEEQGFETHDEGDRGPC